MVSWNSEKQTKVSTHCSPRDGASTVSFATKWILSNVNHVLLSNDPTTLLPTPIRCECDTPSTWRPYGRRHHEKARPRPSPTPQATGSRRTGEVAPKRRQMRLARRTFQAAFLSLLSLFPCPSQSAPIAARYQSTATLDYHKRTKA